MRKALVVGINYYEKVGSLQGCVSDAHAVNDVLARNADGSVNFHVKPLTSASVEERVSRKELRDAVEELFQGDSEIALFYFAGHGYMEAAGGFLCPSDCETGNDGIALSDIMTWANTSTARNKVILLDSCHSGLIGMKQLHPAAELSEGITILTASTAEGGERVRSVHEPSGRRPPWRCGEPRRRGDAWQRLRPHRSVARTMGPATGLQDEREDVRVAAEGAAAP